MLAIKSKLKELVNVFNFSLEKKSLIPAFEILSQKQGFERTLATKKPEREPGQAIPWYTYPSIEYLDQIDVTGLKIFEYGCGQSSLYFLNKGAKVKSVEHEEEWYQFIKQNGKPQHDLILRTDPSTYAKAILETDGKYDIVVVDGIYRNECAEAALERLAPQGIIILDNSDWYTDVSELLKGKGFFQVDFNGFGPCNMYCWTTSILFQGNNVLSNRLKNPTPIGGIKISNKGSTW